MRSRTVSLGSALGIALPAALMAQCVLTRPEAVAALVSPPQGVDCGLQSMTQSSSSVIEPEASFACTEPTTQAHNENTWYRTFRLPFFGIRGPFHVCAVRAAVNRAQTTDGAGQPVDLLVGMSIGKPFPDGTLEMLGSATVNLPDQDLTTVEIPIDTMIPAGSEFFVGLHVPDARAIGDIFYPGANTLPETASSWFQAEGCGLAIATRIQDIFGFSNVHLVMSVSGTEVPIEPSGFSLDDGDDDILEIGDTATIVPRWKDNNIFPAVLSGTASLIPVPGSVGGNLDDAHAYYGAIGPGQEADCQQALPAPDCYAVTALGTRPLGEDADLFLRETIAKNGPPTTVDPARVWPLHVGESFADVPRTSIFYRVVETLLHNGVTVGCGGGKFCPGQATTRQQIAKLVLFAKEGAGYVPPACEPPSRFSDVPETNPFCPFIEELARRGVVSGCGTGSTYCPGEPVKRQQMPIFVLRTLEGAGYLPPACGTPVFSDVPSTNPFCPFIEEVARRGVVVGCGGGFYCPGNPVTREQMAAFVARTFGLTLVGL